MTTFWERAAHAVYTTSSLSSVSFVIFSHLVSECRILILIVAVSSDFLVFVFIFLFVYLLLLLAHLSRRLIGELIVYEGIRRPSVRCPSVNIFKRHLL